MKNFAIVFILCCTALVFSQEMPENMSTGNTPKQTCAQRKRMKLQRTAPTGSLWKGLQRMPRERRENAEIRLLLAEDASDGARQTARQIEELWNTSKFEQALSLCPELDKRTNDSPIAVLNAWQTTIPTDLSLWGDDVLVSGRDSVLTVALDIHRASGNLFAVIRYEGDGAWDSWSMNYSTDGGENWMETFYVYLPAGYFGDVDASVAGDYCHVGYSMGDAAYVSRFHVADGAYADYITGNWLWNAFTATDDLDEVCLTSNQDVVNNRLYYLGLSADGSLDCYWNNPVNDTTFFEIPTGITNAREGLDAAFNLTCEDAQYFMFASYYTQGDSLVIDGYDCDLGSWQNVKIWPSFPSSWYTSISAYQDTVICFHEYQGNEWQCRYWINYEGCAGGTNWYYYFVDDTTMYTVCPDVTARSGGGIGVAYQHGFPSMSGRYTHRGYAVSPWDTPVTYTDYETYEVPPSIEHLGDSYGTLYVSGEFPYYSYFDRTNGTTDVEEFTKNGLIPESFSLSQNFPNPFNPVTEILYGLPKQTKVTLEVYNSLGQKVSILVDETQPAGLQTARWDASALPNGIYFYQLKAGEFAQTKKMLFLK